MRKSIWLGFFDNASDMPSNESLKLLKSMEFTRLYTYEIVETKDFEQYYWYMSGTIPIDEITFDKRFDGIALDIEPLAFGKFRVPYKKELEKFREFGKTIVAVVPCPGWLDWIKGLDWNFIFKNFDQVLFMFYYHEPVMMLYMNPDSVLKKITKLNKFNKAGLILPAYPSPDKPPKVPNIETNIKYINESEKNGFQEISFFRWSETEKEWRKWLR